MPLYEYQPLRRNEIRLLELQSWEANPLWLLIQIRHVSLSEANDTYEALSYVWGEATVMRRIYCGPATYLMMAPNLWAALHRCRWRSKSRWLWVDSLCINQNDLAERGSQVALMRQIYECAKNTVVHLGLEANNSPLALAFLNDIAKRCKEKMEAEDVELQARRPQILANPVYEDDPELSEGKMRLEGQWMFQRCAESLDSSSEELFSSFNHEETQRALVALLARPWFQRAWVIQEFVVAKGVIMYCGNDILQWDSILIAFCYAFPAAKVTWDAVATGTLKMNFHCGVEQMVEMHSMHSKFKDLQESPGRHIRPRLLILASNCRRSKATFGVDKLYSLYGLSSDFSRVTPDYKKSEEEAYIEYAKYLIKKGDGNQALYQAAIADQRLQGLSSWIPDWGSIPSRMNFGDQWSKTSGWLFNAGGKQSASGPKPTLIVNGRTLITKGYIMQKIATVGNTNISESQTPNLDHFVEIFRDSTIFQGSGKAYPTGEKWATVMEGIFESDQFRDRTDTSSWENLEAMDAMLQPELQSVDRKDADFIRGVVRILKEEDPVGIRNMARSIRGRSFAVTDKGYAGLVPTKTKVGDTVCILRGLAVPFILREERPYYTLIGDCYIHGMMQGEMLDMHQATAIRLQ